MKLYICSKLHENIDDRFKVIERIKFETNNFKGHYFAKKNKKNVAGIMVLILYTLCLMLLYICIKLHGNIIGGIKVIERTRFSLKNSKGHNFTNIVGGVTVLVLCTLSNTSLFLYPVS